MTGAEFRAWREGVGMTQERAAVLAGVSRKTILRAEAATGTKVAAKIAIVAAGSPELIPEPMPGTVNSPKAAKAALKASHVVGGHDIANPSPELRKAMLRNPPFATTAAEAKAMRHLRAAQKGVFVSTIRLLPLRPVWRRLDSGRQVNGAIPDPLDVAPPAWAGPRGVMTKSGAVYDYEAAHRIREPASLRTATVTAGDW